MQTITNGIQRVSRYCRRAGTNNRLTFQLANKIANVQISVTERITPFCNGVALVIVLKYRKKAVLIEAGNVSFLQIKVVTRK